MTQLAFPWKPARKRANRSRRSGDANRKSVARTAPSAVRVPDPKVSALPLEFAQSGPHIFIHEGARQALERRFEIAFGGPVQLAVTDNRHRMVSHSRNGKALKVRVHLMFVGGPDPVVEALVEYVLHGCRESSTILGDYIQANGHRIRPDRPISGTVRAQGDVHDLEPILDELCESYLGLPSPDLYVTWARRTAPKGRQRKTIKLGSYSPAERLIRIHPALDEPWVPKYFVSYILYHELMHDIVPPVPAGSRVLLHPPEFRRREREFRDFERALAWENRHIDRLLRSGS